MNREDYYEIYQLNLTMLETEIDLVKKMTQANIGSMLWLQENNTDENRVIAKGQEVAAGTRLYAFLICSWLEARLLKILYEKSSAAFSDSEIESIRNMGTMVIKWKECFSLAVCKSYGFDYSPNAAYSDKFTENSIQKQNYNDIINLFVDIEEAITIRNRLAHGQWSIQFNSSNSNIKEYDFFTKYNNIQKLDVLYQYYNEIAEIISAYVTYKDKMNSNFDSNIQRRVHNLRVKMTRVANSDFSKYSSAFMRSEGRKRSREKYN